MTAKSRTFGTKLWSHAAWLSPLVIATGAGGEMCQSLGTAVF